MIPLTNDSTELHVIAAIALLLFGEKKLPELLYLDFEKYQREAEGSALIFFI